MPPTPTGTEPMKKLTMSLALACCLAGCATQQQAAIPPSPTGCYYREPALHGILGLIQSGPRYTPAPCNVVNANQPVVTIRGGDSSVAPNFVQPAPMLPPLPQPGGGGAWSMAGPGGAAGGAGGVWSGAGPGWAGGGTGLP
jgi:hypothetical protein